GRGMAPQDLAKAYDFDPLWNQGMHGEGQTVAIYSGASFADSDPATFAGDYGLTGPAPQHVAVNGGSTETTSDTSVEVNLDVDTVRAVAPGAQVLDYESTVSGISGFASSIAAVVNQVVADGKAKILSVSYGICDVATLAGQAWLLASE